MNIRIKKEWRELTLDNYFDLYYVMQQILLRESRAGRAQEHVWVLGLANNLKLMYIELVSLGSMSETVLEPMQVFRVGLIKGAAKIIMAHNHPGENIAFGELEPSPGDDDVTDRMIQVGHLAKIEIIEHMIITERFFYSYVQSGRLEELKQSEKFVPDYILKEKILKEIEAIAEERGLKKGLKKGKREGKKEGKKQGLIEGEKRGLKRGRKEGLKEGEQKGLERGKKEGIEEERERMVLRCHNEGLPIKTIAALTKLSQAKVKEIINRDVQE